MDETLYRNFISYATELKDITEEKESEFWAGYMKGLTRLYEGSGFLDGYREHFKALKMGSRGQDPGAIGYYLGFLGLNPSYLKFT